MVAKAEIKMCSWSLSVTDVSVMSGLPQNKYPQQVPFMLDRNQMNVVCTVGITTPPSLKCLVSRSFLGRPIFLNDVSSIDKDR